MGPTEDQHCSNGDSHFVGLARESPRLVITYDIVGHGNTLTAHTAAIARQIKLPVTPA